MMNRSLAPVLENDLCIGCGACAAADSSLTLGIDREKQMIEPDGVGSDAAAQVCPSIGVDYAGLQNWLFPGAEITALGVVEGVHLAQSTNHQRNLNASSGGLIKELLHELLARDDVDGIISLSRLEGIVYEPALVTESEAIDQLPGSIYHSLSFARALEILQQNTGRYVLIAIPCQLEGIYKYIQAIEPALRERIHTTIGLVCGWQYTHHALRAICEYTGVSYDQLTDISYRGGGPVGPLRLVSGDRETRVHRRIDVRYQAAFDRSFNIPRCHLCINHANFPSDIVVGDAWLPSTIRTKTGISIVVTRKASGSELLAKLAAEEKLRLIDASPDDLVESQTRRVAFGDFAYAYASYRRESGLFAPDLVGPNRGAAQLVPETEAAQFHRNNTHKIGLQRKRHYKTLLVRKLTREIGPFATRYLRWFFVRVLKVKSLFGVREEISADRLRDFR